MKLLPKQTDESALASFGKEAATMLMQRDYVSLANRFGYALAYGRELAAAIEEDYERAAATSFEATPDSLPSVKVKYFAPNVSDLFALVECVVPVAEKSAVLLELIVTGCEEEKHITVEDISGVAA
jgi:hypothetical protein